MLCNSGVGRRDAAVHGLSCCREQSELEGCAPNPPRLLPARGSFLPAEPGNSTAGCCCWAGSCAVLCALWQGNAQHPCVLLGIPATRLPHPAARPITAISCCGWRELHAPPLERGMGVGNPITSAPLGGFQTYSAVALQLRVELRASYSDVCGRGIGCCINHSSGQPAFGARPCF